ncbi:hypothetical protein SK069_03135 [Patulibacter brassicae]|uniref:Uncharacterized protein n=1 Tax=Patulibacter brassicae TaxID=1705717 RepID=A0ABU4VIC5_9ACTN|nr:hypothetical protein [Patulibacter brassicae]MDX8150575.1 hypothetical protein [Patulibacter brassicae]
MLRRPLLRAAPLALSVPIALALAPSASAADGTYSVYACKGPNGAPIGAAGWTASPSAPGIETSNGCASGGALRSAIGLNPAFGARAVWSFDAPPGLPIVRLVARRTTSGLAAAGAESRVAYRAETNGTQLESCEKQGTDCPSDLDGELRKEGLEASSVRFLVSCNNGGLGYCTSNGLSLDVAQAIVGLKDAVKPTVSNLVVADDGESSGVLKVRFDAADQGGGLYRTHTTVDGQPLATQPLGDGTCADADPADGNPYQFTAPQPCPLGVTGREIAVDYRKLAPGPHTVLTEVEDAAGNSAAVHATQFPRPNGSTAPGGSGNGERTGTPDEAARLLKARLRAWFPAGKNGRIHHRRTTIKRGARPLIRGYVVDSRGKGIRGALVDVYHRTRDGKRRLVKTGLKTRAGGRLTYIVSAKLDTRRIELAYRALRPGTITSRQTLSVRVTHKGRTYYFPANRKK